MILRKRTNILIIDDEVDMCEALSDFLMDKGYIVSISTNGQDALKVVKESIPDVILLDIKMPGMDGIKVLQELKKINDKIVVIIITAYGDKKTAKEVLKLGAYDYITKPFQGDKIVSVIKEAMGKSL